MRLFPIMISAFAIGTAIAAGEGQAQVDWISDSNATEPGKPLQTAVRMVIDPGWHTYWTNPGEGGLKTTFEWRLPPGWSAGEAGMPVPKRFLTGELPGFGYEGTVLFPVVLTPPMDFTGSARIEGSVSWLACNDGACVSGEGKLSLSVNAGPRVPSADSELIHAAMKKVPADGNAQFKLDVAEDENSIVIRIEPASKSNLGPEFSRAFPVTPDVVDAGAEIRLVPDGGNWVARVPKSEYAPNPVVELDLVLVASKAVAPISLSWRKSQ